MDKQGGVPTSFVHRNTGLTYQGRVSAVPGVDQFKVPRMANFPAGSFCDVNAPSYIRVLSDAGGAGVAPQGEQKLITAYAVNGTFTAPGFSAPVGVGDWVQVVPAILGTRYDDAVYFNSVTGVAGTGFSNGTPQNPSSVLADVRTMLAARKLSKIVMPSGFDNNVGLDADMPGLSWFGQGARDRGIVDISGHNGSGHYENVRVSGNPAGSSIYAKNCMLSLDTSAGHVRAQNCSLASTKMILASGIFNDCYAHSATAAKISIPYAVTYSFTNWSGGLEIYDFVAGGSIHLSGDGIITIDVSCTGGDIYCPQDMQVNDLSGGLVTVHRVGGIKSLDAVWFSSVNGVAGAADNNGTPQNPSSVLADVRTMLAARKLSKIVMPCGNVGASNHVALDVNMAGLSWVGGGSPELSVVDLAGFNGSGAYKNIRVEGDPGGSYIFAEKCIIATITTSAIIIAKNCKLSTGSKIILAGGTFVNCCPYGKNAVKISIPTDTDASFYEWSGDIEIHDMIAASIFKVYGNGVLTIDVSCTGGDLYVEDNMQVIDNSGGLVTVHYINGIYGNKAIKTDTAAILSAVTGGAADARFQQSACSTVEEDALQGFDISIYDIDLGAVLSADIDITAISAIMEKSTGGAAFSSVGITQPTFAKADGRVYVAYRFLAVEWATGDIYRLRVSGIKATVDTVVTQCPAMVWSNLVVETFDILAAIQRMWRSSGDALPINVNAILASETNVLSLNDAGAHSFKLEHLRLEFADPGANNIIVRLYERINLIPKLVNEILINSADSADKWSLFDLFGLTQIVGNYIIVTVQVDGGGPHAVTGTYAYDSIVI